MTSIPILRSSAASLRSAMADPTIAKTIMITGCNSGIGLAAAKIIRMTNPRHRLILVARDETKARETCRDVFESTRQQSQEEGDDSNLLIPMACDHSSLKSIDKFVNQVRELILSDASANGDDDKFSGIDVICLNAAVVVHSGKHEKTADGFDLTFQTNHLAPFIIMNRIADLINPGGRVVVTASSLHRKQTYGEFKGMIGSDGTVTRDFEMIDGSTFNYHKAYAMSKLCNVSFTMELNRRLQQKPGGIVANCFSPGLMTQSGLFRNQNQFLMALFSFAANYVFRFGDTVEWGAGCLAWMALADKTGLKGGDYWSAEKGASFKGGSVEESFIVEQIGEEAANEVAQQKLWTLSADLANIQVDAI